MPEFQCSCQRLLCSSDIWYEVPYIDDCVEAYRFSMLIVGRFAHHLYVREGLQYSGEPWEQ